MEKIDIVIIGAGIAGIAGIENKFRRNICCFALAEEETRFTSIKTKRTSKKPAKRGAMAAEASTPIRKSV